MLNFSAKRQTSYCGLIIVIVCWGTPTLQGTTLQDNAWTNAVSGNWEGPDWSLGALPGTNQDIYITNAGWKAVAIGPGTAQNYPQTLNVDSITLASPPDSCNVLLLNYAGYQTPLIANVITLNSNSVMTILASTLEVTNAASSAYRLEVGGTVNQGEFSAVSTSFLSLGNIGPGIYNLTNGTLNVVTGCMGGTYSGQLNQYGGYNSNSLLRILGQGEYDLYDGSFGGAIEIDGGVFKQIGGAFNGSVSFYGTYELQGGLSTSASMIIPVTKNETSNDPYEPNSGEMLQTGGTNQIGELGLGGWFLVDGEFQHPASGSYALSNGVLVANATSIEVGGAFTQSGGIFTNYGQLGLSAEQLVQDQWEGYFWGNYTLNGGYLVSGSIAVSGAHFAQSGGTNEVGGTTTVEDANPSYGGGGDISGSCTLSGGLFTTANMVVSAASVYQSGGGLYANNLSTSRGINEEGFDVDLYSGYYLSGGQLVVSNLQVGGFFPFYHQGGTLVQQGLLTLAGGLWNEQTSGQQFGPLQLDVTTNLSYPNPPTASNSVVSLPTNGCVLRFADSSSLTWASSASLIISNWAGSPQGGGSQQVIFGANGLSLTPQQLAQISFANPRGYPSRLYTARILSSGEIVPNIPPPPVISAPTRLANGNFSLMIAGETGFVYGVEVSTDLLRWSFWTNQNNADGTITFVDTAAANVPRRFYRAFVQP